LIGDAGGVRRVAKRRLGDKVKVDDDNSFPAGVMSPSAERRVVERSFGIKLKQFLIGDLGRSGEGMVIKGDWIFDLLMGEDGKRCGILTGVFWNDVTFSCSNSEARPRFVLKRLRG